MITDHVVSFGSFALNGRAPPPLPFQVADANPGLVRHVVVEQLAAAHRDDALLQLACLVALCIAGDRCIGVSASSETAPMFWLRAGNHTVENPERE